MAAVGGGGVAADDHQILAAVDIGLGGEADMAVHMILHDMMGNLVESRGGIEIFHADGVAQGADLGGDAIIMGARVAHIHGRLGALPLEIEQPRGDFRKGLLPADFLPLAIDLLDRLVQAVGIILQVGNRGCLGTDMATAEHMVGIAPDRQDLAPLHLDQDAAIGFADMAGAGVDRAHRKTP